MAEDRSPRDVAAAWRPERPGRRGPRDIVDALVEPDWGGLRVVAALAAEETAVFHDGAEVSLPAELAGALSEAFDAVAAVIEGHLTTSALRDGTGAFPPSQHVERPPVLVPRAIRRNVRDDPFVHAREHEARSVAGEPAVIDALERGERHAFVATDLLWLDGQPLAGVPLLERKRLLGSVLRESQLVRVTAFVRPSAILTLVTWGALGFPELSYRAANSRYLAGQENPDWAVARPPAGPAGPGRPSGTTVVR